MSDTEKALNYYRAAVEHKRPDFVPSEVRLPGCVIADSPPFDADGHFYYATKGIHACKSNQWGAISVKATNGKQLGVKPGEFEVTAWRLNTLEKHE